MNLNARNEVKRRPPVGVEKRIERAIRKELESMGYKTYKIHVGQYGPNGFPDLLIIKDGITSYLEVKALDEEPADIQWLRIKELRDAGCIAQPVWSVRDALNVLKIHF
jgi:hypothetical protein